MVFFDVHRTCGRCRACTVHRTPTRCSSRRVYGITDSATEGLFGGWAQAIYLEPGVGMAHLPAAVALDDYIGGGCGLLTAVHIAERAEIRLGDSVVVQGAGAVGLSAIALARIAGASRIIAIGAPASRLALARDMGADLTLDLTATTAEERRQTVFDTTHGEGADVVIEAAGAAAAIAEGLDSGARRWPVRHRRPLHGCRRQHDQRAPADQSQAPRDPRVLGQRGAPLSPRAVHPRAPSRHSVPVDRRAALRAPPVE